MRRFMLFGCMVSLILFLPLVTIQAAPEPGKDEPAAAKPDSDKKEATAKPDSVKEEAAATKAESGKEDKTAAKPDSAKDQAAAAQPDASKDTSAPTETDRQRRRREKNEKAAQEKAEQEKKTAAEAKKETEAAKPAEPPAKSDENTSKPAEKTAKPAEKTAKQTVVCLTLKGDYPEGPGVPGLFGEMQPSLAAVVQRMDAAAADKDVRAVWLKIEDHGLGRGKIYELRGAIARLRKANKPVYAELTTADSGQYLLASGVRADRHAAFRHVDRAGRPGGSHLLQGPVGQARPAVRRPADGQVQGRCRAVYPQRNEQAAAGKLRRPGRRHLRRPGGHHRRRPADEGLPGQDAHRPGAVYGRRRQEAPG